MKVNKKNKYKLIIELITFNHINNGRSRTTRATPTSQGQEESRQGRGRIISQARPNPRPTKRLR